MLLAPHHLRAVVLVSANAGRRSHHLRVVVLLSAPMLGDDQLDGDHTTTSGGETGVPSTFRTWRDVTCKKSTAGEGGRGEQ